MLWCGAEICEERTPSGAIARRKVSDGTELAGIPHYYSHDHLGSLREVTDSGGFVVSRQAYDPFGRLERVVGTIDPRVGFSGHEDHRRTSLVMTLYRAYDASLGRWLSRDPSGFGDGPSSYLYVRNNPSNLIDATGLWASGWSTGYKVPKDKNTIVCDGQGNVMVYTGDMGSPQQAKCVGDCLILHELIHKRDADTEAPGVCQGKAPGLIVGPTSKSRQAKAERDACDAEIACLNEKLKCDSGECRNEIKERIQQQTDYRKKFQ